MTPVVHCKRDPYDVYIGRGNDPATGEQGQWGNPIRLRIGASREGVLKRYRRWLWEEIKAGKVSLDDLAALDGKALGCWCAPNLCHGEVLAAAAAWAAKLKKDRESLASDVC